jgi:NADH-ubiquinone oxidoreductase chain 5
LFVFFIFLGSVTKRAQIPFSAWLPAAMAAPTPVSSLVHSSTLVTAGVYLLIRFNLSLFLGGLMLCISLGTLLLGGLGACFEMDFKKIIAISTLRQLGFMIFVLSLGIWELCYLHMLLHAVFKSLLFMRCGSLMVSKRGGQDSRFFGFSFDSVSGICFLSRVFSLRGIPFCIGFYSKDTALSLGGSFFFSLLLTFFFFCGCLFTVIYRFKLIKLGFFGGRVGTSVFFSDGVYFFCFLGGL